MFINKKLIGNFIITVYVNDFLICDNFMNLINQVLKHLQSKFEIADLKEIINYFNIKIDVTADSIIVCQYKYIQLILDYFYINKYKSVIVLILLSTKLVTYQKPFNAECQI